MGAKRKEYMNLDFLNGLANRIEGSGIIKEFISELGDFLQNAMKQGSDEMNVVKRIEQQNKVSLVSRNRMRNEQDKIFQEYGKEDLELVTQKIEEVASRILEEQKQELEDYRREGHVYLITEDTNGRIYLSDQTESRGFEIEEVDFPEGLKNEVAEGTMLKYENGRYMIVGEELYKE